MLENIFLLGEEHGMKKALTSVLVAVAVLLCTMSDMCAGTQNDKDWTSFTEDTYATMASTPHNHAQGILYIYFEIDGVNKIGIFPLHLHKTISSDRFDGLIVPGKIRVDRGRIHDTKFLCMVVGQGKSAEPCIGLFDKDVNNTLVREASKGSVLRISIDLRKAGVQEPFTLEYSLRNFSKERARCESWVRGLNH